MMTQKYPQWFSLVFTLFYLPVLYGQNNYTLQGVISDASNGEPMIGATVIIKALNTGITSNNYGFYSLSLPQGSYALEVSYLGFESQQFTVALTENKQLDIALLPASDQLEEVIVTGEEIPTKEQNKSVISGIEVLSVREIKSIPPLLGEVDITRALLTQAGISSVGEGSSGFNVRGGNIDQNLVLLDEAPLYNPTHLWGFFSAFNADAIKNVKLYKGGIPARYGGRGSSVLEIFQREGNNQHFEAQGGLGVLFSRLTLEGPIKKDKMSFLIAGRRSFFDFLQKQFASEDSEAFKVYFYDLSTKLSWIINKKNRLYISGYFGADILKINLDGDDELETDTANQNDEVIDFQWQNATGTVRWNHIFGDKLFMNLSGVYSNYNYGLNSSSTEGGGPGSVSGIFDWNSRINTFVLKPDFTFYPQVNQTWRFGLHTTHYRFLPAQVTTQEKGINDTRFETEIGIEIAPYFEVEQKWERTTLLLGLRYSWFGNFGPNEIFYYPQGVAKNVNTASHSKTFSSGEIIKSFGNFEPRLSLKYSINNRHRLRFGIDRNLQYLHLISNTEVALPFDLWKPAGEHITPLEVWQTTVGWATNDAENKWLISADIYAKRFRGLIEYKNGADLFLNNRIETQLLPAQGYAYGLELSANKTKGKLQGEVNYTFARTLRHTTNPQGQENINQGNDYPSNFDRPHILNLTANYTLGKKWQANLGFTFQSGRPYSATIGQFQLKNRWLLAYSNRNAYRLPPTHRLDLSLSYQPRKNKTKKRWKNTWNFGVYNLYGAKNPFTRFAQIDTSNAIPSLRHYQFSVIGAPIPFINYNFKF